MDDEIITDEVLPKCIKETRLLLGITQKALCEILKLCCKITTSTLSLFENSKLKPKVFEKYRKPLLQWYYDNRIVLNTNKVVKIKEPSFEIDSFDFSQRFKTLRKKQNLSQSKICVILPNFNDDKTKLHQGTISSFERNKFNQHKMLEVQSKLNPVYDYLLYNSKLKFDKNMKKSATGKNEGYKSPRYSGNVFNGYDDYPATPFMPDQIVRKNFK